MGSTWFTGGVAVAPRERIRFDFHIDGVRYRPTIKRPPSEANLRRALERLTSIKQQIAIGTFSFAEEFPDYRYLKRLVGSAKVRTCDGVFDEFLAHCEARVARHDMAPVTLASYRRVLNRTWRPALRGCLFHRARYSQLVRVADLNLWAKKTYNNVVSVLRRAFDFGFRDHPEFPNPASGLRVVKLRKRDRPKIDPFCIQDAETLIAALRNDWGAPQGNYDEFRFFTGLRPSEEIALVLSDIDIEHGVVSVNKACVAGSTGIARRLQKIDELCCVRERSQYSDLTWSSDRSSRRPA